MTDLLDDLQTDQWAADDAVRTRITVVQTAIGLFQEHAFHEVGFDSVATAAGLSVDEVRAQFPTWNDLLVATIDLWTGRRMRPIRPLGPQAGAVAFLRAIIVANAGEPGLMRTLSATVNIAAIPGHPMARYLQEKWHGFHQTVRQTLVQDVAAGREPDTMDPSRGAEQLIALYEGLQLQSMVRPGMDVLAAYDRAVTRLRDGWTQQYTAPVWELHD